MKKLMLILFLAVILTSLVSAHQPKLVSIIDAEKGVMVKNPEISKAFYSELNGKPHHYTINSAKQFPLYVGILIPGKSLDYNVSFQVSKDDSVIFNGDGNNFTWWEFYENYGKEYYMTGPEFGLGFKSNTTVPAGNYVIKVFNENNKGKYSLAIGDIESFPALEIVKAIINTIRLRLFFF